MQAQELFPSFPDDAQVWIYAANRNLSIEEQKRLTSILSPFLRSWVHHGRPVTATTEIFRDRFLIIAAYKSGSTVTGCGIDASTSAIEQAGIELGVAWASPLDIFYLNEDTDEVASVSRSDFRDNVMHGQVNGNTLVFNLNVQTVSDLRNGEFIKPAKSSWHARAFKFSETTI